jgi:hypothetical protein
MWVTSQTLQFDDPFFLGLMSGQPAFSFAEGFNEKMLDRRFGEKEKAIKDPGGRFDLNGRLNHLKMFLVSHHVNSYALPSRVSH